MCSRSLDEIPGLEAKQRDRRSNTYRRVRYVCVAERRGALIVDACRHGEAR
jgi:hypothetical protein